MTVLEMALDVSMVIGRSLVNKVNRVVLLFGCCYKTTKSSFCFPNLWLPLSVTK